MRPQAVDIFPTVRKLLHVDSLMMTYVTNQILWSELPWLNPEYLSDNVSLASVLFLFALSLESSQRVLF